MSDIWVASEVPVDDITVRQAKVIATWCDDEVTAAVEGIIEDTQVTASGLQGTPISDGISIVAHSSAFDRVLSRVSLVSILDVWAADHSYRGMIEPGDEQNEMEARLQVIERSIAGIRAKFT